MKRSLLIVLVLALLTSLTAAPRSHAATSSRTKKYAAEHHARLHRHHVRKPAKRHARMVKYAAEHRARQHRHRAHLKHRR